MDCRLILNQSASMRTAAGVNQLKERHLVEKTYSVVFGRGRGRGRGTKKDVLNINCFRPNGLFAQSLLAIKQDEMRGGVHNTVVKRDDDANDNETTGKKEEEDINKVIDTKRDVIDTKRDNKDKNKDKNKGDNTKVNHYNKGNNVTVKHYNKHDTRTVTINDNPYKEDHLNNQQKMKMQSKPLREWDQEKYWCEKSNMWLTKGHDNRFFDDSRRRRKHSNFS